MIALCARSEIQTYVEQLNYRGLLSISQLLYGPLSSVVSLQQQLEDEVYTHFILDLDVFGNYDTGISLLTRLADTRPQMKLLVLAENLSASSSVVRDLLDSAQLLPEQVFFERGAPLLAWLNHWFVQDGLLLVERTEPEAPAASTPWKAEPLTGTVSEEEPFVSSPQHDTEDSLPEPPSPRETEESSPALPSEGTGRLNTREAHCAARSDPPALHSAVTVAVAGAGRRIGCTTQAMQILHFLRVQGYSAAIISMQDDGHLSGYFDCFPGSQAFSNRLIINGIDIIHRRSLHHFCQKRLRIFGA